MSRNSRSGPFDAKNVIHNTENMQWSEQNNAADILTQVNALQNAKRVDLQLAELEPLAALLMYDIEYDHNLISRLINMVFDVMHTQLEQLVPCVIGINKCWTLVIVRSKEVAIVYGVLDLLCHLTASENLMGSVCKRMILEQRQMSLVHHAHAVVQSLYEWCMFQPLSVEARTPYYKNAQAYKQLSLIDSV